METAAPLRVCVLVAMRPPSKAVQMRPSRMRSWRANGPDAPLAIGPRSGYNPRVADFRILGPLEAVGDDGTPIALGGTKQRALLAVLLLRAGEVVSIEALVLALWGETAPRTATPSLQNSISQLRKLLGADILQTRAPGYVLAVPSESIDLGRFERPRPRRARARRRRNGSTLYARRSTSGGVSRSRI